MLIKSFGYFCMIHLAFSFAFVANAAVKDCSTIEDLSKDLGPAWNQGKTSWCHSFTATDAMTRHLLNLETLKPGERLHPLRIAAAIPMIRGKSVTGSTSEPNTMHANIGDLRDAKNSKAGLCKETDLSPAADRSRALYNEEWEDAEKIWQVEESEDAEADQNKPCRPKKNFYGTITNLEDQLTKDEANYWETTFMAKCKIPMPKVKLLGFQNRFRADRINLARKPAISNPLFEQNIAGLIDTVLKSNELAGIGYDANFLRVNKAGPTHGHWSSIVGRKLDDSGKCVYLVRNSWGADCKQYKPEFKCEEGHLTVPADQLLRNVHTVEYIGKP